MPATLIAKRHRVADVGDAIEFCFQQGWTDGLPVIPPTEERVRAMLEAAGLDPKQEIGFVTHRAVSITADRARYYHWLMLRFRVLFDQQLNQRLKQGFASLPNIMDKLEETEIEREFLL